MWVAFPMCENPSATRRAADAVRLAEHPMADLAIVEFRDPIPAGMAAAPLRCPKPGDVVGLAWWAFGFAHGDPRGSAADGAVGTSLGYGWCDWTLTRATTWNRASAAEGCGARTTAP